MENIAVCDMNDEYGRKIKNFRGLASELMQLSTGGQNSKSSRVSQ
jgi:hypothetical protein